MGLEPISSAQDKSCTSAQVKITVSLFVMKGVGLKCSPTICKVVVHCQAAIMYSQCCVEENIIRSRAAQLSKKQLFNLISRKIVI